MIVHQAQRFAWLQRIEARKDGRVALSWDHVTDVKVNDCSFCHFSLSSFFSPQRYLFMSYCHHKMLLVSTL